MPTEFGAADGTAGQAPSLVRVNWREVVLFGLLAYGLAWAWSGFFLLPYLGELLTRSTTPTDMLTRLGAGVTLPTMLTPMISALIMRIFVSREGVNGSESQAVLTRRSESAKQPTAEDSGHYIQVGQLALANDAVRHVVQAARDGSHL